MSFEIVTESQAINKALFQITHGLYILTSKSEEKINGQCIDALMQVTNAPPRIAIGLGKTSLTYDMIRESGHFCVSVLNRANPSCGDIVRRFGFQSGRDVEKFADFDHMLNEQGIPYLPDAIAVYECTVLPDKTEDVGTHSLIIASVDRARTSESGEPLTYNEYRKTLRKERR